MQLKKTHHQLTYHRLGGQKSIPANKTSNIECSSEDLFEESEDEDASAELRQPHNTSTSEADTSTNDLKIYKRMKSLFNGVPPTLLAREVKYTPGELLDQHNANLAAAFEPIELTHDGSLFKSGHHRASRALNVKCYSLRADVSVI